MRKPETSNLLPEKQFSIEHRAKRKTDSVFICKWKLGSNFKKVFLFHSDLYSASHLSPKMMVISKFNVYYQSIFIQTEGTNVNER